MQCFWLISTSIEPEEGGQNLNTGQNTKQTYPIDDQFFFRWTESIIYEKKILMLALLVEYIFLTTFYGLYFIIFIEKFSPLTGFEPGTSPGTKPICYQLSYPGLDNWEFAP